MSKKDKLIQYLKENDVTKLCVTANFDFEAMYPSGTILLAGVTNDTVISNVYDMYSSDESLDAGQLLYVTMWPEGTHNYKNMLSDDMEEIDVNV